MTQVEALTQQRNNLLQTVAQLMDENALLSEQVHKLTQQVTILTSPQQETPVVVPPPKK